MATVSATDARTLAASFTHQTFYVNQAYERCQAAIIDQAKKGKMKVRVALSNLSKDDLSTVAKMLHDLDFLTVQEYTLDKTTSFIDIDWSERETDIL